MTPNVVVLLILLASNFEVVFPADPCFNNGGCDLQNGLCWKTSNSTHYCTCKAGFDQEFSKGRHRCIDINECFDPDSCNENALCENTHGSYECRCRCGFVKDYTNRHCLDASHITGMCMVPARCYHEFFWLRTWFWEIPFKAKYGYQRYMPDLQSGRVRISSPAQTKGVCSCEEGLSLDECGYCEDIDECRRGNPCEGDASFCVNTEGSYYCECGPGFFLGPCRRKCYGPDEDVPELCEQPNLEGLASVSIDPTAATFQRPFILTNWKTCAENVIASQETIENYDVDQDGIPDVRLTWLCAEKEDFSYFTTSKSVLKQYSEEEAKWGRWSCWTKCKATCWGGLQTRSRKCLHGLPGVQGCHGEGSQKRECYSGPKCQFRVRKNVKNLNESEISDVLQAFQKYKNDDSARGFRHSAAIHGWPFLCKGQSCCPHGSRVRFLSWHRFITMNLELGLSRYMKNKPLGLPYWNWLSTDDSPPDLLWNRTFNGNPNPFVNMTVLIDRKGPMRTIQRNELASSMAIAFARETWENVTRKFMHPHTQQEFAESLENAHGGIHLAPCEEDDQLCRLSFAHLEYSSYDPLFLFHHSQTDRLWAVAQKKMEEEGRTTWTAQTALEPLEERGNFGRMLPPFGNKTINGHTLLGRINTLRDSYYSKELLGVLYDDLSNDGFPSDEAGVTTDVEGKELRADREERLFIAQHIQSIPRNVHVNYYDNEDEVPCEVLTTKQLIASTVILGTDGTYRKVIPNLVPATGIKDTRLNEEITVTACYTRKSNCTEKCPEATSTELSTMPNPHLLYYVRNQPVDIYKFNWSPGVRMPNWRIHLRGSSQWVFFYGWRRDFIIQVPTASDWLSCNAKKGRSFACSDDGQACLLPVGVYYMIDEDYHNCKRGLRMIIASAK